MGSNLTRYNQTQGDRATASHDESLFGHYVEECGWTVKEALENLAPIAKQTYAQTVSVAGWAKWLAVGGSVVGLLGGGTVGLIGALPIGAAFLAFCAFRDAQSCIPRREIELRALKNCPVMLDLMYGCHLKGIEAKNLIAAWDIFLDNYAQSGNADGNLMAREYLRILDSLSVTIDHTGAPIPPEPPQVAPAYQPSANTQLGAIEVQASQSTQPFTIPIASPESKLFDWNQLNTAYDDFPHLLLLGKTGAGKSFLAEKMGRFLDGTTIVITPKKKPKDFTGMQVIGVPYDFKTIAANITGLATLVRDREAEMNQTGQESFMPINVVLDEVPTFVAGCKDIGLDVVKDLKFIIRAGRTSKVRLILLAQGQEVKTLGIEGEGSLRDNLSYIYLKGFAEKQAQDLKLDISKYDRPCLIDGKVADISKLIAMAPDATPHEVVELKPTATPQDLERMYNLPSVEVEHETEEDVTESASSLSAIRAAFPNWKTKSIEVASLMVDWLQSRSDKSFAPYEIRKSIRRIKDDSNLTTERLKLALDALVSAQILTESDGKYTIAPDTDDYDF
ncbi:hypothetical protein ACQ4M3_05280 [Leptolyngbya sp. AN03gr2]|uniref:hypothetical protein n=1 Tax=unclassified Leptolyngbya TaxID=2650499 RepID=UPI003D32277A